MKNGMKAMKFAFALLALTWSTWAGAQHSSHYVNGVEGMKAASLPPPGIYWRNYTLLYTANHMRAPNRIKNRDVSVDVFGFTNRAIYVTDQKVLGADYGFDLIVPLVYTNFEAGNVSHDNFSVGDITVEPVLLAWHGKQWDTAFAFGLIMPTGNFNASRPDSPGKGYWTGLITGGGTYYFDEATSWHASLLARYEFHSKQRGTSMRPGEDFHFEWGVGKTFANRISAGLAGYAQWQLQGDKDNGVLKSDKQRAYAIGPEISYVVPKWKAELSLRHLREFGVRNGTEGSMTTFVLTKAF